MACRIFVIVFICLVSVVLAFGETESPLEKAEALMTDGKFYEGNEYKGIFSRQYRETLERYESLKHDKEWNSWLIILD